MGVAALRFRFAGEPPTREHVNRELRAQMGEDVGLSGYRREGTELLIYVAADDVERCYAIKVLRDLGGTLLDFTRREPSDEHLPAFVEKPWREYDEPTRRSLRLAFQNERSPNGHA
jgi:hypothetical protein